MSNSIFSNSDKKTGGDFQEKVDTHSKTLVNIIQRQKDLESSLDLFNEKIELLDHNSVKNFKNIFDDVREIKSDFRDLKQEVQHLKDFNEKVTKQLRLFSAKDDVAKLEKYIDLWNPMDFVTREELREHREKMKEDLIKIIEKFLEE